MLKTALKWLDQGIAPIPVLYQDKKPAIQWGIYQTQLPTRQEVKRWFSIKRNLAIIAGWQNLTILDFDDWGAYLNWFPSHTQYKDTYSVLTSRGIHLYYYLDNPTTSTKVEGIDIKASGYVLAPPSIHPSGIPYVAANGKSIMRVGDIQELVPLPDTELSSKPRQMRPSPWNGGDLISSIKASFDILDAFPGARHIRTSWYMVQCPFHEDKNPSFWIDTDRGLCGCFAGCNDKPMDVIDFRARLDNVSVEDAIRDMGVEIGWYREWV